MVDDRRSTASSAATKRPAYSSLASPSLPSLSKRSKVSGDVPRTKDLRAEPLDSGARSCDPPLASSMDPDTEKVNESARCGTSHPVGKANMRKRKSLKVRKQNPEAVWGQLLSQSSQNPHLVMRENLFTVGQGRKCNLCLSDPSISIILCRIKHIVRHDSSVTVLDIMGCEGTVQVNGKVCGRNSSVLLFGGDEVVFSAEGDHSYVFQQFHDSFPYRELASELMVEAQCSPINEMHIGTRPGSSSSFGLSSRIHNVIEEHQKIRQLLRDSDPLAHTKMDLRKALKESLKRTIANPEEIDVSFEKFPYYLSDTTKNVLVASTFIRLRCNKFVKHASHLSTVSPQILLSCPAGSEIYQETLVKALAKHFAAKLLVVDSLTLPGDSFSKDVVLPKECVKLEKLPLLTKKVGYSTADQPEKPTSSAEAEITGGTPICSRAQFNQEASTVMSKTYKFRKGDRVRFIAPIPSAISTLQSSRGPFDGYRGKVVLAFEGNENGSAKVGVRFEKTIYGGNDLGGLCEKEHGFFCSANSLRLKSSKMEETDKLAIDETFEVVQNACEKDPLILFIKDVEKTVMGCPDAGHALKRKFDNLPGNAMLMVYLC